MPVDSSTQSAASRQWHSYSAIAPFPDQDHPFAPTTPPTSTTTTTVAALPPSSRRVPVSTSATANKTLPDTVPRTKTKALPRRKSPNNSADWRTQSPPNAPSPLLPATAPTSTPTSTSPAPPLAHSEHPPTASMAGGSANGESRPARVNTSTNNLFSSSCQPMRNTPSGESFAKDFIDIFTTLMISLPLTSHRVLFRSYPHTFTTEEALQNMANLRLTQTNRMDDPKNPGRIVTTTTSTSFSIGRDMARSIGGQFVQARLVEAATDQRSATFDKDSALWKITPKGMHVLQRFANRNGIAGATLSTLLANHTHTLNLIILERDDATDEILESASLIELIFRRFAGPTPNIKNNGRSRPESFGSSSSDHSVGRDQMLEGYTGVPMREGRKVEDVVYQHCFTGQNALDWLLENCTTVRQSEAVHLASTFLRHNLMARCGVDHHRGSRESFDAASYYILTERGKRMAGWTRKGGSNSRSNSHSPPSSSRPRKPQAEEDSTSLVAAAASNGANSTPSNSGRSAPSSNNGRLPAKRDGSPAPRETSANRLQTILSDAAQLTLFREFLRNNFCEENLTFWKETGDFIRSVQHVQTIEQVKAGLATAFSHYNAFLAQGSPCELNLDHTLRLDLQNRMSRGVEDSEDAIRAALTEVVTLFERARNQVLRLMASDSVPKFVSSQAYQDLIARQAEQHVPETFAYITPPPEVDRS